MHGGREAMGGKSERAPRLNRGTLMVLNTIWFLYLAYPVDYALTGHLSPMRVDIALGLLAVFIPASMLFWNQFPRHTFRWRVFYAVAVLAWAVVVARDLGSPGAMPLAVYAVAPLMFETDLRRFAAAAGGAVAAALVAIVLMGGGPGAMMTTAVTMISVAVGGRAIAAFMGTVRRLDVAEAEVTALTAANERLRIARDLHDVVGHRLVAVALKADLAAESANETAPSAARAMREVADLTRAALRDVRSVVQGYRRVSLAAEWAELHELLSAAGIEASARLELDLPDPAGEEALSMALREAVTNIIRHSGATRCRVDLTVEGRNWRLSVVDNGRGAKGPVLSSGLVGMRERVRAMGGEATWSTAPGHGFSLMLTAPLATPQPEPQDDAR